MRRKWASLAAAAVLAAMAITVSLVSISSAGGGVTIHVIEHADTDQQIDTGSPGDTNGDLLTFANPVFDEANKVQVGTDQGDCVRIDPTAGTWECRWVTIFPKTENAKQGTLTVEGPFYDTHDSTLAVTGGTGIYKGATGTMRLKANADAGGYDFIFHLTF
jgi:allene oxide cyclase